MLEAQDKEQVQEWSQRQLGSKARLVSVSEKDFPETEGMVEREGTGLKAREAEGCQPVISIMANYVQTGSDADSDHMESDYHVNGSDYHGMMPTIH